MAGHPRFGCQQPPISTNVTSDKASTAIRSKQPRGTSNFVDFVLSPAKNLLPFDHLRTERTEPAFDRDLHTMKSLMSIPSLVCALIAGLFAASPTAAKAVVQQGEAVAVTVKGAADYSIN